MSWFSGHHYRKEVGLQRGRNTEHDLYETTIGSSRGLAQARLLQYPKSMITTIEHKEWKRAEPSRAWLVELLTTCTVLGGTVYGIWLNGASVDLLGYISTAWRGEPGLENQKALLCNREQSNLSIWYSKNCEAGVDLFGLIYGSTPTGSDERPLTWDFRLHETEGPHRPQAIVDINKYTKDMVEMKMPAVFAPRGTVSLLPDLISHLFQLIYLMSKKLPPVG
ncbi:hypothetical protein OBBRIDRAFT_800605 [Obba rivulosa]|uniref:Uncharacterized protein n=1 Tax=Obba rivulosa TaxID=1052685 RepID=A0A8E2DTE9_9APHY|nr:hypothetical protein OBBRIDRAFT_800605 [Obba rivulosa]